MRTSIKLSLCLLAVEGPFLCMTSLDDDKALFLAYAAWRTGEPTSYILFAFARLIFGVWFVRQFLIKRRAHGRV